MREGKENSILAFILVSKFFEKFRFPKSNYPNHMKNKRVIWALIIFFTRFHLIFSFLGITEGLLKVIFQEKQEQQVKFKTKNWFQLSSRTFMHVNETSRRMSSRNKINKYINECPTHWSTVVKTLSSYIFLRLTGFITLKAFTSKQGTSGDKIINELGVHYQLLVGHGRGEYYLEEVRGSPTRHRTQRPTSGG